MARQGPRPESRNGNGTSPVALSSLRVGQCGRIWGVAEEAVFKNRLLDLGFVNGSLVKVLRRSPLRDPVEYEVRNTRICLRRSEAEHILVDEVSGNGGRPGSEAELKAQDSLLSER